MVLKKKKPKRNTTYGNSDNDLFSKAPFFQFWKYSIGKYLNGLGVFLKKKILKSRKYHIQMGMQYMMLTEESIDLFFWSVDENSNLNFQKIVSRGNHRHFVRPQASHLAFFLQSPLELNSQGSNIDPVILNFSSIATKTPSFLKKTGGSGLLPTQNFPTPKK